MKIYNILKNISDKIIDLFRQTSENLQEAKDYSDANLQTAKSYTDSKVPTAQNSQFLKMIRTIGSSESINDITETGLYVINANPPTGISSTYTWSYVLVFSQGGQGGYFVHQFLVKPSSGVFLMREYSGSPGRWGVWKKSTWSNL